MTKFKNDEIDTTQFYKLFHIKQISIKIIWIKYDR